MTVISSVGRRSNSSDDSSSLLQNSYFIAAVAIVFALVVLRIVVLRWRNQRLSDFFRLGTNSQYYAYGSHPPNDADYESMYHGLRLAPPPAVYHPDRRVRAADTDASGRRLDPTGENRVGKDVLPAYDNFDRPPKYVEAGWTHGGPSLPVEQSAVTASEQCRTAHSNTASSAPVNDAQTVGDTIHETEVSPYPVHGEPSGC